MSEKDDAREITRDLVNDAIDKERLEARWRYAMTWRGALAVWFGALALISALLHLDLGIGITLCGLAGLMVGCMAAMPWRAP